MGRRTYIADSVAIALLYRKQNVGSDILSYEKACLFDDIINDNLDAMNSDCGIGIRYSCYEESKLFVIMTDENGKQYAVINPSADLKDAWSTHVGYLPLDVVIASHMDNALAAIDLEKSFDPVTGKHSIVQKDTNLPDKVKTIVKTDAGNLNNNA